MVALTKEIFQSLPDETVFPIVAQNGDYSSVYLVYKVNNTDDLCVYGVTCDDENAYVLENTKQFGANDAVLSWNDFRSISGTTCAADASYMQSIGNIMNTLGELFDCNTDEASLLRQDAAISGTPISEFVGQKALYYVNFE